MTKLNPEPVMICTEKGSFFMPRNKIASAYAGAVAAKRCLLHELSALCFGTTTFEEEYQKAVPISVAAANAVGLSSTWDLISGHYYPDPDTNVRLEELLEHRDNPYYPFFDDFDD